MKLTIQIYHACAWQDAATLEIPEPELGTAGPAQLIYQQEYALKWIFHDDYRACSLYLPVELMLKHYGKRWFGFLEDIMPAGGCYEVQNSDPG